MSDDEEIKVTQYLVPANVTTRFEFFPGIGWYELRIIGISLVIGVLLFLVSGLPKKTIYVDPNGILLKTNAVSQQVKATPKRSPIIPTPIRLLLILIPGAGSFFLVKRDPSTNMSVMVTLRSAKEFKSKQRRYLYRYGSGSEV